MMKRVLAIGLALAVSRVLASDGGNSGSLEVRTSLAWSRVVSARAVTQSGIFRVVRSQKEWDALLHELDPTAPADRAVPAAVPVDFATWMVLYIALPSTAPGSHLSIEYAWNLGQYIEVQAVEVRPTGPSCVTVGGGIASIIALIPSSALPVNFSVAAADLDCQMSRRVSVK